METPVLTEPSTKQQANTLSGPFFPTFFSKPPSEIPLNFETQALRDLRNNHGIKSSLQGQLIHQWRIDSDQINWVPYADEPLRFQLASPPKKWEGVRDAKNYGQRCIQRDTNTKQVWGSEDCLFLNVFTPEVPPEGPLAQGKFPVLVFIHGGAFLMGSGDEYNPKYLLDQDVIVVTLNYRLGVFGFLNTEDGLVEENLGLKDQLLALQWIQKNIQSFGGDTSRVTLMGQSAGSACVHFHILSPLSRGLFSAAIMQSGTALAPWAFQRKPLSLAKELSKQLNGPTDDTLSILDFFKSLDHRVLAAADYDYQKFKHKVPVIFAPSKESLRDGKAQFLPDTPWNLMTSRKFPPIPVIFGLTCQEGLNRAGAVLTNESLLQRFNSSWEKMAPLNLFYRASSVDIDEVSREVRNFYFGSEPISMNNKEKVIDLFSDRYFFTNTFSTVRLWTEGNPQDKPVYMYMFGYQGDNSILKSVNGISQVMGVCHTDDLQYIFDSTFFPLGLKPGTDDESMSKRMVELLTTFITHHTMDRMSSSEETLWQPVEPGREEGSEDQRPLQYYFINLESKMIQQPQDLMTRCQFWERLLPIRNSST
ncbi:unnamed protein product [Allacma fusca]|uniref:Carboxylic ester hydrolase n=1 Tax=Allacma fusca TaxID=39272 RepID=A0A8J2KXQ3_9HEXA|nr:unnamed protein product [Allacma fusca]